MAKLEARWMSDYDSWVIFEDGQETDNWIVGLDMEASAKLVEFAIHEQFALNPDDEILVKPAWGL